MEKEQKKSPFSDCLATDENGLGLESLQNRLERYGAIKTRALGKIDYIMENKAGKGKAAGKLSVLEKRARQVVGKMERCGSYLVFKNFYRRDEVRLYAAEFCKNHLLCPFCAMRRGAKYLQRYMERLQVVLAQNPRLRAFMVTLTVKDGENLLERFNHLRGALKRYQQQRRDGFKVNRSPVEYNKALGGVFSVEVKRGSGSGLWHPHVHMIWLCETAPDSRRLSAEWQAITKDSYIVDVREFYGDTVVDGFLEVFKYALKFSDMEYSDNWEAYLKLSGKRLVDNFGLFRGVEVPDTLTDDDLSDEPYLLMLYRFLKDSGYNFVTQGNSEQLFDFLQRESYGQNVDSV